MTPNMAAPKGTMGVETLRVLETPFQETHSLKTQSLLLYPDFDLTGAQEALNLRGEKPRQRNT